MDSITSIQGPSGTVGVADIERELAGLWRSAATGGDHGTVTRACRTNLVVLDGAMPDLVEEVTRRHPARLITIARSEIAGDDVRAQVSALCHLKEGGGGLLCSERIALEVMPGGEARAVSAVRSLAVGDLPVAILGDGDALVHFAAAGLLDLADRILIDSTGSDPEIWTRLTTLVEDGERIIDLAWLRLDEFRRAVAGAIVHSQLRKAIHRLEGVDLGHAGRPTQAMLVLAWLGHRLRWGRPRRPRRRPRENPAAGSAPPRPAPDPEDDLRVLEVSGRGRRIRLRFGETEAPNDLLLLLRTPDLELLATLDEHDGQVHVVFGAGRTRIRHRRQQGQRPGSGPARRERIPIHMASTAALVIDALDHRGRCDRDWLPVFGRARDLAATFSSLAASEGGQTPDASGPPAS